MSNKYKNKDSYFKRAKKEGYKARSVFKLQEIDARFNLFSEGAKVLDIGCYPGSFLQYISERVGKSGRAIGVDLEKADIKAQNAETHQYDIFSDEFEIFLTSKNIEFDVITSDAAPNTSGIKDVDHARSLELNERVFKIAQKFLKPNGSLLMKMFMGSDFQKFLKEAKKNFEKVKVIKPKASKRSKKEIFIVGIGKL